MVHTRYTVTDLGEIDSRLMQGRLSGYASNGEGLIIGDMTIPAAVVDRERRPMGSVLLSRRRVTGRSPKRSSAGHRQ
ncbi:hypothetical protein LJR034_005099 [Caballeronia sp. LjRoot34]|uniref:hypothetical protein n=1 Tax=Caballeronia sp. LjRoot34 TaxID=3342325 RepID=UPI003ED13032